MATERVTFRPEGQRARTVYLTNVREGTTVTGDATIFGTEVDADGNPNLKGKDGGSVTRHHVIEASLVVRRVPVVMDNIYGEFVEVS